MKFSSPSLSEIEFTTLFPWATFSPSAYIQMAGRGLRGPANGGKDECLIVDLADNFGDINDLLGFREYEDLWREQHE